MHPHSHEEHHRWRRDQGHRERQRAVQQLPRICLGARDDCCDRLRIIWPRGRIKFAEAPVLGAGAADGVPLAAAIHNDAVAAHLNEGPPGDSAVAAVTAEVMSRPLPRHGSSARRRRLGARCRPIQCLFAPSTWVAQSRSPPARPGRPPRGARVESSARACASQMVAHPSCRDKSGGERKHLVTTMPAGHYEALFWHAALVCHGSGQDDGEQQTLNDV